MFNQYKLYEAIQRARSGEHLEEARGRAGHRGQMTDDAAAPKGGIDFRKKKEKDAARVKKLKAQLFKLNRDMGYAIDELNNIAGMTRASAPIGDTDTIKKTHKVKALIVSAAMQVHDFEKNL